MKVCGYSLLLVFFLWSNSSLIECHETHGFQRNKIRSTFGTFKETKRDSNEVKAENCNFYSARNYENGTYSIKLSNHNVIQVYCSWKDDTSYTLVQRRGQYGNSINFFNRNWKSYEKGFGDPFEEYWLGLENLRDLTRKGEMDMILSFYDKNDTLQSITLQNITFGNNATGYKLRYKGINSPNLDLVPSVPLVNSSFSTWNRDFSNKCASISNAAWWFTSNNCFTSNLNGLNLNGQVSKEYLTGLGIIWESLLGLDYSITKAMIQITDHDVSKKSLNTENDFVEKRSNSKEKLNFHEETPPPNDSPVPIKSQNMPNTMNTHLQPSDYISKVPTISYESTFCKNDLILLGCKYEKGTLQVLEVSIIENCATNGFNSDSNSDDCLSIQEDFFLKFIQNECNHKGHCVIGNADKFIRRNASCIEDKMGIKIIYTCSNMDYPTINGTESIGRDFRINYAIDGSTSSKDKYYYKSMSTPDPWILIDLKSHSIIHSIMILFRKDISTTHISVSMFDTPVNEKSYTTSDIKCLMDNEVINNNTIRSKCESDTNGRYIWIQVHGNHSLEVDEIYIRSKMNSFVEDCLTLYEDVDVKELFKTYKSISIENCRGLCGIIPNCFGFGYDLDKSFCHLSNGSARVLTAKHIVSGNKSCIGEVKEQTNLQEECQHESTKAIGTPIDKYSSIPSVTLCHTLCKHLSACQVFTYSRNTSTCTLFAEAELSDRDHNYVTGDKSCDGYIPNCFVNGFEYSGTDVDTVKNVGSVQECQKLCQDIPYCFFWTYKSDIEQCTRKSSVRRIKHLSFAISGSKNCYDSIIKNVEFTGYGSLDKFDDVKTPNDCRQKCTEDPKCSYWNLYSILSNNSLKICETRYTYSNLAFNHNCKSGYKWKTFLPKNAENIDCSWEGAKLLSEPLDVIDGRVYSDDQCQYFCRIQDNCSYWSYNAKRGKCFLYYAHSLEYLTNDLDFVSGPKYCDGTCYAKNIRFNAEQITTFNDVKTPVICQNYCKRDAQCSGFNFVRSTNKCILVKEGPKEFDSEVISGVKNCRAREKNIFVNLEDCYNYGVNYKQGDLMQVNGIIGPWECQLECQKVQRCSQWTYNRNCFLKTDHKGLTYTTNKKIVSGPKYCLEYKQDVEIKEGHFRTVRKIKSAMKCQSECDKSPRCLFFSYNPPKLECHLKTKGNLSYRKNFVSGSKTPDNKNERVAISPIIPPVVRTPNCFSYGLKYETSGSVIELKEKVDSVETCHKFCKYRAVGCKYFVFFNQRRKCFLLEGALRRVRPCSDRDDCISGPSDCKDCFEHGLKKAGRVYTTHSKIYNPNHCQLICREGELCISWSYDVFTKNCHLYKTVDERKGFIGKNYVSGLKECGERNSPYKPLVSTEKRYLTALCFLEHVHYAGEDIDRVERVYSAQECQKICQTLEKCHFWSWNYESQICYRKTGKDLRHLMGKQNYFSGPRVCENCFRKGINLESKDIKIINETLSPRDCQIHCKKVQECKLWVLIGRVCHLRKERITHIHIESDAVSGTPECSFVLDYHNSISGEECISDNIMFEGTKLIDIKVSDYLGCELSCIKNPFCTFWTFDKVKLICTISKDRRATNFHKNSFVSGEIDCQEGCYEFNVNYIGQNIDTVAKIYNPEFCQYLCQVHSQCSHWTYVPFSKVCLRKKPDFQRSYKRDYRTLYISGLKFCGLRTLMEHNEVSCVNIGYSYDKNNKIQTENSEKCAIQCKKETTCNSWTFEYPNSCYLSTNSSIVLKESGKISGPKQCQDCFVRDVAYSPPFNKTIDKVWSPHDCQRLCTNETICKVFTFIPKNKTCYLNHVMSETFLEKGAISGPNQCVYSSTRNKISQISPDFIKNRQNNRDVIKFRTRESQLLEVKDEGNEWYPRNDWNAQVYSFTAVSPSNKSTEYVIGKILNQTDFNHEKINKSSVEKALEDKDTFLGKGLRTEPIQLPRKKKHFNEKRDNLTNITEVEHEKTSNSYDSEISKVKDSSIENSNHIVKYKKIQYYIPIKKKNQTAEVKLNVEATRFKIENKTLDSRDSKAILEEKKSNEASNRSTASLINDFMENGNIEILLADENGLVEDITGEDSIEDYVDSCFVVGIKIDVPNRDIYSSLKNPFECAVFCKLHSECFCWTFRYKGKVCEIKKKFTAFDVKFDKDSVSGLASCNLA